MRMLTMAALLALSGPALAQNQEKPATVEGTAGNIAEKPLKDLNIIKPKVPPLLESIMKKPYDTAGLKTCADYASAIRGLDAVLGKDVDSPAAKKSGDGTSEFALKGAEDIAGSLIPGGGILRRVTGADKEAKHALAAIYAGGVRRAYLKGAAFGKGCKA